MVCSPELQTTTQAHEPTKRLAIPLASAHPAAGVMAEVGGLVAGAGTMAAIVRSATTDSAAWRLGRSVTGVRGSRSMRIGSGRAVGLVIVALAVAKVVDRAVPAAHVAVGLGLVAFLVAIARAQGFTAADLGLARSNWPTGLRWGAAAAALVGTAYALAYVTRPVWEALPDGEGGLGRAALWRVLVVIPLGTVLPEELAFRGLLLALLGRRYGVLAGALLSSGLFGLWHVVPSLGGGTTNATMASMVGADAAGTVARVIVTVGFTSLAGVVLCWLRLRSGSLVAPVLAHWTVNGLGVIVALLV